MVRGGFIEHRFEAGEGVSHAVKGNSPAKSLRREQHGDQSGGSRVREGEVVTGG